MLKQKNVSVSTSVTQILAATTSGQLTLITNMGSSILYIGGSDVSITNGLQVSGGTSLSIDLQPGEPLYGIRSTGTANALVVYSNPFIASSVVPQVVTIGLGSTLPSSPATVATTTAGLPGTPVDGQLALIRVGTWPDTEYVELTYDATNARWVSLSQGALLSQTDQTYMGTNSTSYAYIQLSGGLAGTPGSATAAMMGWGTRPIRQASALLTTGLKLQVAFTAIVAGTATELATYTVMPRFFQNSDGDSIVFSADGSTAVAELASTLVSPASHTATFKATGWVNVVKLGTQTPITSTDVTKNDLWPRLYGIIGQAGHYGSVIDADLQYRWTT